MADMAGYAELTNGSVWYDEHGSGDPLVLLHGGAVDARFFEHNLDGLAERGVRFEHYEGFEQDERGILRGGGPPIAWLTPMINGRMPNGSRNASMP